MRHNQLCTVIHLKLCLEVLILSKQRQENIIYLTYEIHQSLLIKVTSSFFIITDKEIKLHAYQNISHHFQIQENSQMTSTQLTPMDYSPMNPFQSTLADQYKY